jgi:thioredoxin reductase (NADPH)
MTTYSHEITLLTLGRQLSDEERRRLEQAKITVEQRGLVTLAPDSGQVRAYLCDGTSQSFDAIYSALGCDPRSALGRQIGCRVGSHRRFIVTEHQETSEPNVWAAGDVVRGLNQISVALGEAAIAATAIHNRLAALSDQSSGQPEEPDKQTSLLHTLQQVDQARADSTS